LNKRLGWSVSGHPARFRSPALLNAQAPDYSTQATGLFQAAIVEWYVGKELVMQKNLFDRSGEILFSQIMVGEEFYQGGSLYHKVSYETAIPISYRGDEKFFFWDEVVSLNPS
jgi:hypothetical protein